MKYFFSWAVFWLIMVYLRNDIPIKDGEKMYGGYAGFWQFAGALYPLGGVVIFILGAIFCTTKEEFDHDVEKALAGIRQDGEKTETTKPSDKVAEVEMVDGVPTNSGAINS